MVAIVLAGASRSPDHGIFTAVFADTGVQHPVVGVGIPVAAHQTPRDFPAGAIKFKGVSDKVQSFRRTGRVLHVFVKPAGVFPLQDEAEVTGA